MRSEFLPWLEQQYDHDVAEALLSRATRVERYHGDLDRAYETDRLEAVLASLRYTPQDERRRRPNPSRISFEGNIRSNINAFRAAVEQYRRFRAEVGGAPRADSAETGRAGSPTASLDDDGGQKINLERDLQAALRDQIDQLEPGLKVIDGGAARQVETGSIDITARDAHGRTVVILLKAGVAGQRTVGQILNFMGEVQAEEPDQPVRGLLIASTFDRKGRSMARMAPALSLRRYAVSFQFLAVDEQTVG